MPEAITSGDEASRILRASEATTRALERAGETSAIKTSSGLRVFYTFKLQTVVGFHDAPGRATCPTV